jgi:hypothetical protein
MRAKQAAEKPNVFEGDGLQAVRKSLKMHAALAPEGPLLERKNSPFGKGTASAVPQTAQKLAGFSPCGMLVYRRFQQF